ncbi:mitochondrial 37S ribosomal protein bS21m [Aspergillus saccharolyticus JOP 1030-1]|uniref:Ribosomal protein S21 n=1 Tax=Aspergillus saccharolyticus JOP 1030-1 TaxID=1450539 RepID=A0A318ZJ75_9EURO|nr:hypothetical protein BP01DRAFT_354828 [Aspergillus saccharolyticus JOP 1030-1]PYH47621.1 hypothetical protein BP01DRAFT_354828 [Aspergillus saccharolyticus JOP 1030-1]
MEMRALARCLRSTARPSTTSLLYTKQFARQSFPAIRYNSSDSSASSSSSSSSSPPNPSSTNEPSSIPSSSTPSPASSSASAPNAPTPHFYRLKLGGNKGPRDAAADASTTTNTTNTTTTTPTRTPVPRRPAPAETGFDEIFKQLNLGGRNVTRKLEAGEPVRTARPEQQVELKLGPEIGRQVLVQPDKGFDLAASLRYLDTRLKKEQLLNMSRAQKFHTRKGLQRKMDRRARWRKLFKFSFKDTLKRVQRMRAQGW